MSRPEILKRVVERFLHLEDVRIIRVHQGQFLFVHQHAGGNRRRQVITLINQFGQHRYIGPLECVHAIQIPELQLWHAAALLLGDDVDVNAVVLKHLHEIFTHLGAVVVAITGRIERHLAGGFAYGCRVLRLEQRFDSLAHSLAMQLGQRRLMVNIQAGGQCLSEDARAVECVDGHINERDRGRRQQLVRAR